VERRKEPRILVNQAVSVTVLSDPDRLPFQAVAVECSGSGMRILSPEPVSYLAALKVEAHDLVLLGEVIRSQASARGHLLALELCHSLYTLSSLSAFQDALEITVPGI
jgi:hypothetical protein